MAMKSSGKSLIYNELADIPDEFVEVERPTPPTHSFEWLRKILRKKGWIKSNADLPRC